MNPLKLLIKVVNVPNEAIPHPEYFPTLWAFPYQHLGRELGPGLAKTNENAKWRGLLAEMPCIFSLRFGGDLNFDHGEPSKTIAEHRHRTENAGRGGRTS